jgi:hypothetical protein
LPEVAPPRPKLRSSERSTFKRCQFKWHIEFAELRKPVTDVPPLRFGSLIHAALAAYYQPGKKRGPHPAEVFADLYRADVIEASEFGFRVDEDEYWVNAGDLGVAMLTNYIDTYGADDEWEVLVTEIPFAVPVKHAKPFYYVGILDGIWRNLETGLLWVPDHKTAATINTKYLALDEQASAYWTFGLEWLYRNNYLPRKEEIAGLMFNFLRKSKPDERKTNAAGQYLNKDGSVSAKQPPPYFERKLVRRGPNERAQTYNRVQLEHAAIEAVREGGLDLIYKNAGPFTCMGCWVFDICELHEIGADWREFMESTTKPWDPYAEHEVREGR